MTEPSGESIERFFRNECSAKEAEQIAQYLEQHPGLLDSYTGREDWDAGKGQTSLPASLKEEMRKNVYQSTRTPVRNIWMIRSAVAACIAGLLILGSFWISHSLYKDSAGKTLANTLTTATVTRTLKNPGEDKKTFVTPEGSKIELAAHSECSYQEPFASNARDFRLKGEAVFDVVKDVTRPFTVYAGSVVTTALGTVFRVRAVDREGQISVQLISGKVVVRTDPPIANRHPDELYLSPGDEMVFDKTRQTMALHSLPATDHLIAETAKKKPSVSQGNMTETAETWTFYNLTLTEIMGALQKAYGTDIGYSKRDLSKIRFTGTFNKSDSLSFILNTISSISKLRVSKDGGGYKVEK